MANFAAYGQYVFTVMKRFVIPLVLILFLCLSALVPTFRGGRGLEIPAVSPGEDTVRRTGFTLSYQRQWRIPKWVAYELEKGELDGPVPRERFFYPDPRFPNDGADVEDYRASGWDRGHMAPAGDMKWDAMAMRESFYFSNVCPQNRNLNNGDWHLLEKAVRRWAARYGRVYVVCGPVVTSADSTIGRNRVVVPQAFFKAVLSSSGGGWKAAGFFFPNRAGHYPMAHYAVTVDSLESLTGIDFFPRLPDRAERRAESELDSLFWDLW